MEKSHRERQPCVTEIETGVMRPQSQETGSSGSWESRMEAPPSQGHSGGTALPYLDFSFLVCRGAPQFSVIGYRHSGSSARG